jgi:hypothetical protein
MDDFSGELEFEEDSPSFLLRRMVRGHQTILRKLRSPFLIPSLLGDSINEGIFTDTHLISVSPVYCDFLTLYIEYTINIYYIVIIAIELT